MTSLTIVRFCAIAPTAPVTLLRDVVFAIPQDAPAAHQGGQGGGQGGPARERPSPHGRAHRW